MEQGGGDILFLSRNKKKQISFSGTYILKLKLRKIVAKKLRYSPYLVENTESLLKKMLEFKRVSSFLHFFFSFLFFFFFRSFKRIFLYGFLSILRFCHNFGVLDRKS